MKKYGGFIPGIRAGRPTAEYLDYVLSRITLPGSLYLALVALDPAVRAVHGGGEPELPVRRREPAHHRRRRTGDGEADRRATAAAALRGPSPMSHLLIVGPPGAGKGTQSARLREAVRDPGDRHRRHLPAQHQERHAARAAGQEHRRRRRLRPGLAHQRTGAHPAAGAGCRRRLPARRLPPHARAGRLPRQRAGRTRAEPRRGDPARGRHRGGGRPAAQARGRAGPSRRLRGGHPAPPGRVPTRDGAAGGGVPAARSAGRRSTDSARWTRSPSASSLRWRSVGSYRRRRTFNRLLRPDRPSAVRVRPNIYKSPDEMRRMLRPGLATAASLTAARDAIVPGATTRELDLLAEAAIRSLGGVPNFMKEPGYRHTICASVNEDIVHGIPGERVVAAGDIVSIDSGAEVGGWNGDAAITVVAARPRPPGPGRRAGASCRMSPSSRCGAASPPSRRYRTSARWAAAIEDYIDSRGSVRHPRGLHRPRHRTLDARGAAGVQLPRPGSRTRACALGSSWRSSRW